MLKRFRISSISLSVSFGSLYGFIISRFIIDLQLRSKDFRPSPYMLISPIDKRLSTLSMLASTQLFNVSLQHGGVFSAIRMCKSIKELKSCGLGVQLFLRLGHSTVHFRVSQSSSASPKGTEPDVSRFAALRDHTALNPLKLLILD